MNLETAEYLIFACIVIFQFISFVNTRKKIAEFNQSISDVSEISITEVELTQDQTNNVTIAENIFDIVNKGITNSNSDDNFYTGSQLDIMSDTDMIKIKLVESTEHGNRVFNRILNALNKYLLRNRHSVADFSLIKDIVERNTNTLEDDVNLTLSTPLYLGLMGTMLGVVIGIFSMSHFIGDSMASSVNEQVANTALSEGISTLLGSVKIAMIGSFVGLLLTIYNSAIAFKGSKHKLESKKNEFYTLIQVELLPSLNQGMNATFDSLQRNLFRFNEKFDTNLDRLTSVFDKNYDSILMQKKLMEQMDSSKVADISKYNLRILNELNTSLMAFDKFNSMFANVNTYIANSYKLAEQSTELLNRTGNFEKIAATIESNLIDNNKLISFLSSHFSDLETHKRKIDEAIIGVGFSIKDTFEQLNASLQKSSEFLGEEAVQRNIEAKKLFEEFAAELKLSFAQQADTVRTVLDEKKSSLDHLKHLETLVEEVRSFNDKGQLPDQLIDEITQVQTGIQTTNETLKRMEKDGKRPLLSKLFAQKSA